MSVACAICLQLAREVMDGKDFGLECMDHPRTKPPAPVLVGRLADVQAMGCSIEMKIHVPSTRMIAPGELISLSPRSASYWMRMGRAPVMHVTPIAGGVVMLGFDRDLTQYIAAAAANDFVYLEHDADGRSSKRYRPGQKHGPDQQGGSGPCEPDCVKCALEPMPNGSVRYNLKRRDEDDHAILVEYLLSAVRRGDWHGVADAACDLRVLEAKRER